MEEELKFIDHQDQEKRNRSKKTAIKRRYYFIMGGLVSLFGGYVSTVSLQSSIRVQDGLGTKITTVTYATMSVFSFFVAPAILRLLGPKKSLILAECGYLIYVLTNLFSSEVLLYVGALGASFGESILWIPVGICFIHFAKKYHPYSKKSEEECVMEFGGSTLGIFQLCQVIGNGIIVLVLNILNPTETSTNKDSTYHGEYINTSDQNTFTTLLTTATSEVKSSKQTNPFQYCGSKDCQDQEIIKESIDQYIPTNPIAFYVIISCFILMVVLGIICHIKLVPEMSLSSYNQSEDKEKNDVNDDKNESKKKSIKEVCLISFETSKALILQFLSPHQLLFVTPYGIYVGLSSGFFIVEATRAFAACILGINQVGVCVIIYAFFNSLNSVILGKLFGKRGRIPLLIFGVLYDVTLYSVLLLWQPNKGSEWAVYLFFGALGISNSICQVVSATLFGSDYYKTKEISFNIWMITFSLGLVLQNALSTLMCVYVKIYIMISWVLVSSLLAGIHEHQTKTSKV